ncbi:hypothetical protein [uncultured Nitrosomonas sp.]|uniref:hypothetical protein n=1 Tax=uncultured Nitrosomonas sp. TaxID=156424 RepID=UPI0025D7646B|nr:hypothetical protein [uncultured Nitrosomonas sp.]
MKFHHPIFTLLLLSIATSGLAVNTTLKAAEVAVNSAGERLDNPIPNPIQKGSIRLRLKQIATGLMHPIGRFLPQAILSTCTQMIKQENCGVSI